MSMGKKISFKFVFSVFRVAGWESQGWLSVEDSLSSFISVSPKDLQGTTSSCLAHLPHLMKI